MRPRPGATSSSPTRSTPLLVRVEDRGLRRASRSRSRSSCGRSGGSSRPGCTRTNGATRSAFVAVGGACCSLLGCVVAWFTVDEGARVPARRRRPRAPAARSTADKYLTLVMLMFAAFGVAFEFPLLLVFLLLVGVREHAAAAQRPALGGRRDHDVRGGHHPQPGPVLPIVHGRSHVHLLRGRRS